MLDRDGNGFISKQELGMAMRSLGYMPSEVELAIIMQRLDMDGESSLLGLLQCEELSLSTAACVWGSGCSWSSREVLEGRCEIAES